MALGSKLGILCSGRGAKPFPFIKSQLPGANGALDASKSIALPSGISAGDLLLVVIGAYSDAFVSPSIPAGWNQAVASTGTSRIQFLLTLWKIADGTETSIVINGSNRFFAAWNTYVIAGGQSAQGAITSGSSGAPDSPSLSPSWGNDSNLWIAVESQFSIAASQSAPSGYTNFGQTLVNSGGLDVPRTAWANKNSAAATENPGAFGAAISGSGTSWVAATVAIRPSS